MVSIHHNVITINFLTDSNNTVPMFLVSTVLPSFKNWILFSNVHCNKTLIMNAFIFFKVLE